MGKYNAFIALLFLAVIVLGIGDIALNNRVETNEALINNMSKEMKVNTAKINTFLEDASIAESWANSIYNLDNELFVRECAFVFQVPFDSVTQTMFNQKYLLKQNE